MKPVALVKGGPVSPYADSIANLFYESIEDAPDRAHAHFSVVIVDTILKAEIDFDGITLKDVRGTIFMRMESSQLAMLSIHRGLVSSEELKEMSAAHVWLLADVPNHPTIVLLGVVHPTNPTQRIMLGECPKDRPEILVNQLFRLLFSSRQDVDATAASIEATDALMKKLRQRTQ